MFQLKSRSSGAVTMAMILGFVISLILLMAVAIPIFIDQQAALTETNITLNPNGPISATSATVLEATGVILIVSVLALVGGLVVMSAKGL